MNGRFGISVNRKYNEKLRSGDPRWGDFNDSFRNVELSLDELIEEIQLGHAICAQHTGRRSRDRFVLAQHFALDFDNRAMEEVVTDPFIANHAAFLHTTPSHTPTDPRCRAVFLIDRAIRDLSRYQDLLEALVEFKYTHLAADKSCKDGARFFFGSLNCETMVLGNVVSLDTLAQEIVLPYREFLSLRAAAIQTGPVALVGHVPARLLEVKLDGLLEHILSAPDGEKHVTLNTIAYTLGGYVASGYYDREAVRGALQKAILTRGNLASVQAAFRTIDQAITDGETQPLYIHSRLPAVPLTAKSYAQGFAAGYRQAMLDSGKLELWLARGLTEGQVDYYSLGYTERVVDGDGVITAGPSLVMPCYGFGRVQNDVRYIPLGSEPEQYDSPTPFFLADTAHPGDQPLLVLSSPEDAIFVNLFVGDRYAVAAAPLGVLPPALPELEKNGGVFLLPVNRPGKADRRIELKRMPFASARDFLAEGGDLEEFLS